MTAIRDKKSLRNLTKRLNEVDEYIAGKEPSADAAWWMLKIAAVAVIVAAIFSTWN